MRVRTGKPVKATSLLGQANIPHSVTGAGGGWGAAANRSGGFTEGWPNNLAASQNSRIAAIQAEHIYFAYAGLNTSREWKYTRNCPKLYFLADGSVCFAQEVDGKYYTALGVCCSILEPTVSGDALLHLQNYNDFWTIGDMINCLALIDITNIPSLRALTAEQIYNQYKDKLELLASGREIVLDGKTGKVNYATNSDVIPCNAAAKTYGYNQLAMNGNFLNDKTNWVDYCSSTTVANGVAEITRTSTSATSSLHQDVVGNAGDKFYVRSTMWSDGAASCRLGLNGGISWSGTSTTSTDPVSFEVIKPISSTGTGFRIELFGLGDEGVKYYAKEVNAINLTDWYGAGKEPSTVAEFKQKFPNDYYGFCNKNLKLTQKMINAGPLYGYNQLLDYDTQYPTSVSGDNATFVKSGKYITLTKKDNTNYYSFELSTGTNAKAKYGDKIYIKFKFTNFVPALNGLTAGLGIAEYGPSGWLKNPGRAMTYTAGVYEYETIDSVRAETTTHVRAKILHTTGTGISGELLTAESCEIINLTEWFGAGNEPATVEEFKQRFPHDYYPYSQKSSLNAYQINAMATRN